MATPTLRAGLFLFLLWLGQAPLGAQDRGPWSGCRQDSLSVYNCASYYSGTVSLASELKTGKETMARSIVAVVTAGRVICRVKETGAAPFEGPGMLSAEHAAGGVNAGGYTVRIWCPAAAGKRPGRGDAPTIDSYDQSAADYGTLEGKDAHEHPDADPANGVSGTETIAWQLKRNPS